jgi:hypothetical protein
MSKQYWLVVVEEKGPGTTLNLFIRKSPKAAQKTAIELFESGKIRDEIWLRAGVDNLKDDLMLSKGPDILVTLSLVAKWKAQAIANKRSYKTFAKLA